jgi:hypothetical protein
MLTSNGFSLLAGLGYFWSTAIGKAILLGITIGIVLLIVSLLGQ